MLYYLIIHTYPERKIPPLVVYSFIICLKANFVSYLIVSKKPNYISEKIFTVFLLNVPGTGNTNMINIWFHMLAYDLSFLNFTLECRSVMYLRDAVPLKKIQEC